MHLFMFKSLEDFKREFGFDPESGVAMVAINDCADMRAALERIQHLQSWLARAAALKQALSIARRRSSAQSRLAPV
jgi:hypothetical protein